MKAHTVFVKFLQLFIKTLFNCCKYLRRRGSFVT